MARSGYDFYFPAQIYGVGVSTFAGGSLFQIYIDMILMEVGLLSSKKMGEKKDAAISLSLTEKQKDVFMSLIADWDTDMSVPLHGLILHSLKETVDVEALLKAYYRLPSSKKPGVVRGYKTSLHLCPRNYQRFKYLAESCCRTSAEMFAILVELFNNGIIKKLDIWK
jgi:hypothetical protein